MMKCADVTDQVCSLPMSFLLEDEDSPSGVGMGIGVEDAVGMFHEHSSHHHHHHHHHLDADSSGAAGVGMEEDLLRCWGSVAGVEDEMDIPLSLWPMQHNEYSAVPQLHDHQAATMQEAHSMEEDGEREEMKPEDGGEQQGYLGGEASSSCSSSFTPETCHSSSGSSNWNPSSPEQDTGAYLSQAATPVLYHSRYRANASSPPNKVEPHQHCCGLEQPTTVVVPQRNSSPAVAGVRSRPQRGAAVAAQQRFPIQAETFSCGESVSSGRTATGDHPVRKRRKLASAAAAEAAAAQDANTKAIEEAHAFLHQPKPANMSPEEEKQYKKMFRKMKNRISAQNSRNKRAREEEQLVEEKENLLQENHVLRQEVHTLTQRNLSLESCNRELQEEVNQYRTLYGPLHSRSMSSLRSSASPTTIAFCILMVFVVAAALPGTLSTVKQEHPPVPTPPVDVAEVGVSTLQEEDALAVPMEVDVSTLYEDDGAIPLGQHSTGRRPFSLLSIEDASQESKRPSSVQATATFSKNLVVVASPSGPFAADEAQEVKLPGEKQSLDMEQHFMKHAFGGRRVPFRADLRLRGGDSSHEDGSLSSTAASLRRVKGGEVARPRSPSDTSSTSSTATSALRSPGPTSAASSPVSKSAAISHGELLPYHGGGASVVDDVAAALLEGNGSRDCQLRSSGAAAGSGTASPSSSSSSSTAVVAAASGVVPSSSSQLYLWCPMVYPMLEASKAGQVVDLSKPTTISLLVPAQALQRSLRAMSPENKEYQLDPDLLMGPSSAQFLEVRFMVSCVTDSCHMSGGSIGPVSHAAGAALASAI